MKAKEKGGRIIAVGTTSVRALESAAQLGTLKPFQGETNPYLDLLNKNKEAMAFRNPEQINTKLICHFIVTVLELLLQIMLRLIFLLQHAHRILVPHLIKYQIPELKPSE